MRTPLIKFGSFTFDTQLEQISSEHEVHRLEHQQAKLLILLLENRNNVLSREQIASAIWQGIIVEDNTISKAITRLRKVLNDNAKSPQYIKTIPKKGYQFIAEIEELTQEQPAITAKPVSTKPLPIKPEKGNQPDKPNSIKLIAIIVFISIALITWLVISNNNQQDSTPAKTAGSTSQIQALTYREGIEQNAHLHPDGKQLLFVGNTENGYGIFYKKVHDATAKLLTKINSRLSYPKWLANSNNRFIYSEISSNNLGQQQCQIVSAAIDTAQITIKETQVIATCISDQPVEVFVNDAKNLLVWQDLSGTWQYQQATDTRQQLAFSLELGEYQMPSPDFTLWGTLKQLDDKSQLTVYRINDQKVIYQKMLGYRISHFKWSANSQTLYHLSEHPAHQLIAQTFDGKATVLANSSLGSITQISDNQNAGTLEYVISAVDIDVAYFHDGQTELVVNSTFPDYSPSLSSDLSQLAFASKRTGSAQIWLKQHSDDFIQLTNFERASYIYAVLWSPDDSQLLVKRNESVYLIDINSKQLTKLPLNAKDKFAWQWLSPDKIAFIDQQSQSLFSFDLTNNDQQLLKTNIGYAQYTATHWYLSDSENSLLTQYDLNFNQEKVISTQLNGRFWRMNNQTLYLFNREPNALVKVEQDGTEIPIITDRSINHLSLQNAGNQGFIFHRVSQNEANMYQLQLD